LYLQGILGLAVYLTIAWIFSEKRKKVRYTVAFTGVIVQFFIAGILFYVPVVTNIFLLLNNVVLALETATKAGTSFVFGYIGGGTPPFLLHNPGANFILAFQSLPLVLVIGALSSLLYYWKIAVRCESIFPSSSKDPEHRRRAWTWRLNNDFSWHGGGTAFDQALHQAYDAE